MVPAGPVPTVQWPHAKPHPTLTQTRKVGGLPLGLAFLFSDRTFPTDAKDHSLANTYFSLVLTTVHAKEIPLSFWHVDGTIPYLLGVE